MSEKIKEKDKKIEQIEEASIFEPIQKLEEEILVCLSRKERYGLEIIEVFEKASEGKRTINIGTLYTVLSRLERKGCVSSSMEDRPKDKKGGAKRKYFRITSKGTEIINDNEFFRRSISVYQTYLA